MTNNIEDGLSANLDPFKLDQQLVVRVTEKATIEQKKELRAWLSELLEIRSSNVSKTAKCRQAIEVTWKSKVIFPLIIMIANEVKLHGWDNRSKTQKFGIGGAAVGMALFGGAGAGIAALGTAVGVPLWVVIGAGSMFAEKMLMQLDIQNGNMPLTKDKFDAKTIDLTAENPGTDLLK